MTPYQKIPEACKSTGLSQYFLRNGCKNGTVPHVKSGPTYYIDVPVLLERLRGESNGHSGDSKEFCQRYREAFAGVVQDATRRAQQLLEPALSTLQTVMEDEEIPAQARITAAKSIIDYSLKLTEQADILEQLRELERWKEELNGNR